MFYKQRVKLATSLRFQIFTSLIRLLSLSNLMIFLKNWLVSKSLLIIVACNTNWVYGGEKKIILAFQTPSDLAIVNNAHLMARYASVCQVHGLVPLVEPDIDVVNGDHSLERATQVSEKVLGSFFKILQDYGWDNTMFQFVVCT